ncbi:hypothetical protein PV325_006850 [Microctonus aethiopoides]|nr:hypothetical protein PV325_006850 [Microctonus aethiopoides]
MQLVFLMSIFGLLINYCTCWRIGYNKYWLPNLEWLTSANWINGNIPKENSRVSFPLEMYHSVGLGFGNLELTGIELPYDGSLILSRNGNLTINNVKYEENKSNIYSWKLKGPFFWMDPDNWSNSSKATPHFERIPCATDTVILPDINHTLSIRLPNNNVEVMEIKRGNEEILDEWSWQSLINGREFRYSRTSVRYSSSYGSCINCLCKPDNVEELVEEMCSIQSSKCKIGGCEYPLKIEGHCCDFCGGRISVSADSASVSMLTQLTNEALENYHKSISWHVRASWHGRDYQVLFAENEIYSGIKSQEAMDKLTEFLIAKGIVVIDSVNTGAPLTGSTAGNILGPMFGIPIIILLLIIISLPYFGYSYTRVLLILREACESARDGISLDVASQPNESFGFARFENVVEGNVEFAGAMGNDNKPLYQQDNEDSVDDDSDNDMSGGGSGKRFENPLYESTSKILSIAKMENEENKIDAALSLSALKESEVYPVDETNINVE